MDETSKYGPQGKMALWRAEPGKKQVFQGNIELSPELIKEIMKQFDDEPMKLNLIGFKSTSDHPKAPAYSGFASLPTYTGNEPAYTNQQAADRAATAAPDDDEIPF